MKTEASPRPWAVDRWNPKRIIPNENDTRKASIAITDMTHGLGVAGEQDKANAELIVRAVNSHDALVEALEQLLVCDHSAAGCHCKRGAQAALATIQENLTVPSWSEPPKCPHGVLPGLCANCAPTTAIQHLHTPGDNIADDPAYVHHP